ncbi:MAG: tail fiber domain-containing protein [Flavobacterium sp.]
MSNLGGKVDTVQGNIKQFYTTTSYANWIFKRMANGLTVQTPANAKTPVLISNDLIVTGSIYNTSDERLKHHIAPIDDSLVDHMMTLNPILFHYKQSTNSKPHYGFLAQDVEKQLPHLVEQNAMGFKAVNYVEMIPLMLVKMKQMQQELDELRK